LAIGPSRRDKDAEAVKIAWKKLLDLNFSYKNGIVIFPGVYMCGLDFRSARLLMRFVVHEDILSPAIIHEGQYQNVIIDKSEADPHMLKLLGITDRCPTCGKAKD
jgi:hypothetical protein